MKTAGVLAILLGVVLLVMAVVGAQQDVDNSAQNVKDGFQALNDGDESGFQEQMRDAQDRTDSQHHEAFAGAVLVIAGIALVGAAKRGSSSASVG